MPARIKVQKGVITTARYFILVPNLLDTPSVQEPNFRGGFRMPASSSDARFRFLGV
jgi:hypothetical protein